MHCGLPQAGDHRVPHGPRPGHHHGDRPQWSLPHAAASQLGIKGMYSSTLSATAIPQTGGTFTFKGSGGADVGPFTAVVDFSNPLLSWTNPDVATTIDRSQDLKVTWTGGNAGSYVYVTGVSTSKATSTTPSVTLGFTCLANAQRRTGHRALLHSVGPAARHRRYRNTERLLR